MRPTTFQAVLMVLVVLPGVVLWSNPAVAQANPYGDIDASQASISILQSTVGTKGSPIEITSFDRINPMEVERLFEALLDHANPAIRTLAGISLVKRGSKPERIAERLDSEDSAGAMVVGILAADALERDDAIALLDGEVDIPAIAEAILQARVRRPSDLKSLTLLSRDPSASPLARGVAAATIEEDSPGSVAAWLKAMDDASEFDRDQRDRTVFETIEVTRALELGAGIQAIELLCRDRSIDDGLRVAAVLALMQIRPVQGLDAWKILDASLGTSESIESLSTRISIALLLVAGELPAPPECSATIPDSDPLQKAIKTLIQTNPVNRPETAIDAIRRGHVPTMRWFLELPDDRMPVDNLAEIIDRGTRNRRAAMIDLMANASEAIGRIAPEQLIEPLEDAEARNDRAVVEIMLRGLIAAGSPAAADSARNFLQASRKATRSLALLAVASGTEIDDVSLRQLGRIAAGGGDLPQDLRPIAAWQYLRLTDKLEESLPQIMAP